MEIKMLEYTPEDHHPSWCGSAILKTEPDDTIDVYIRCVNYVVLSVGGGSTPCLALCLLQERGLASRVQAGCAKSSSTSPWRGRRGPCGAGASSHGSTSPGHPEAITGVTPLT